MADAERKAYPLRVDSALWAAVERCAAAELRSVNAQVEYLLRAAVAARRGGGSDEKGSGARRKR